jgi:hypothetical protein
MSAGCAQHQGGKENEMIKILGGVFVGVFLSVLTVKLLGKAKGKLKEGMKAAKGAFMEGYAVESK